MRAKSCMQGGAFVRVLLATSMALGLSLSANASDPDPDRYIVSFLDVGKGKAALKAAGARYQMHQYPGTQHGFNNDTTPRYDAAAARLAWERTLAFLRHHLA